MNKDNLRYVEPSQLLRFIEPGRICGLLYFQFPRQKKIIQGNKSTEVT